MYTTILICTGPCSTCWPNKNLKRRRTKELTIRTVLHVITFSDVNAKYKANTGDCKCQCLPHLDSFREDLNICVDDIHGKFLSHYLIIIYIFL